MKVYSFSRVVFLQNKIKYLPILRIYSLSNLADIHPLKSFRKQTFREIIITRLDGLTQNVIAML